MAKERVAGLVGLIIGAIALVLLFLGTHLLSGCFLVGASGILTNIRSARHDPEGLKPGAHFAVAVLLAAVGVAMAIFLVAGPPVNRLQQPLLGEWLAVALAAVWGVCLLWTARRFVRREAAV